jgi:hypothetical protein
MYACSTWYQKRPCMLLDLMHVCKQVHVLSSSLEIRITQRRDRVDHVQLASPLSTPPYESVTCHAQQKCAGRQDTHDLRTLASKDGQAVLVRLTFSLVKQNVAQSRVARHLAETLTLTVRIKKMACQSAKAPALRPFEEYSFEAICSWLITIEACKSKVFKFLLHTLYIHPGTEIASIEG